MMAATESFKVDGVNLMALGRVRNLGGILGELIPPKVWSSAASCFVEVIVFIGICKIQPKIIESKNGFEIRCTGDST